MPRRRLVTSAAVCALVVATLAACTGSSHPRSSPHSAGSPSPSASGVVLGAAGCAPASPITARAIGPEIQGTGHGATLYGLLMPTKPMPVRAGEQLKVVWRMTGSGLLHLTATSPHGQPVALQWGPEIHGGSNYHRPGEEWGAGYLFPTAGCWHLHAQRAHASADVWLQVASK